MAFMESISGVERSRLTLWRYSLRKHDSLPVEQVSRSKGRVRANAVELEAWWNRHRFTY